LLSFGALHWTEWAAHDSEEIRNYKEPDVDATFDPWEFLR